MDRRHFAAACALVISAGAGPGLRNAWAAASAAAPRRRAGPAPLGGVSGAASAAAPSLGLTIFDIVAKHAEARGGLEAWRRVHTMLWSGRAQVADPAAVPLPFQLEMQRPNLTRFEIASIGGHFARIFDGDHGWKLRPGRDGAPETKEFSPEEVGFAREEYVIDGPLLDHEAKGIAVQLEGADTIEGRKAYRLTLRLPSGAARRLWLDAETFLELRYDRPGTHPLARGVAVSTFFRDYREFEGLKLPTRIETGRTQGLESPTVTDKLLIERVVVNPALGAMAFARPPAARSRRAIVNATGAPQMTLAPAAKAMPPQAGTPGAAASTR